MKSDAIQGFDWTDLEGQTAYETWRTHKLDHAHRVQTRDFVAVEDFANPSESERKELFLRCSEENLAGYTVQNPSDDPEITRMELRDFATAMGLRIAEAHRSASGAGVVALTVTDTPDQAGYIPYTPRPLSWHTDGYYNAPNERINAFVLHCARPAAEGGENMLLDPEIAYIRLRDANPGFIAAFMHPHAMTIPEDTGQTPPRPASTGPVFYPDPASGRLQMRYTARSRSIEWRDEALTRAAADHLLGVLKNGDPLMRRIRLKAGQGVVNNNALHNRTGFRNGDSVAETRLIYRVRFHNRLGEG